MNKPLIVRIVKAVFIIEIAKILLLITSLFIFLYFQGEQGSLYYHFKKGFLNSAGYTTFDFDSNAFAYLSGSLTLPLAVAYLNINAINRKRNKLLIGSTILYVMFSIQNPFKLLFSIIVLIIISTNKRFRSYMLHSENTDLLEEHD